MRKTITKVVLIICAVSVALGIALCASGVVMGADVEKALRGIGINVETRIEPNNMYDDYNDYNEGGKYISYLLTPATVCLAVPLYEQIHLLKKEKDCKRKKVKIWA